MRYLRLIPTILISIGLLVFGGMKLVGTEQMLQNMANLHYNEGLTRILGFVEILLAVAIWQPKTSHIAKVLLLSIFAGAIGSHWGHGDGLQGIMPATIFAVLTAISLGLSWQKIIIQQNIKGEYGA